MKGKLMVAGLVLALSGCATSTSMGGRTHMVECNGAMQPMANCFKKAAQICPRGFDMAPVEYSGGMAGGAFDPYGSMSTSLGGVHKSIIVECRG